jgi:uncharacterized circularly permuted ATP-grasp superfamily protein/uncharacterized alpha-E superfamily protein
MTPVVSSSTLPQIQQGLFQGYAPVAGRYDEAFAAPGMPRPHWTEVMRLLDTLGLEELRRRWAQARQRMYENGVTYNPHREPHSLDHSWELDVIPFVLDAAEWGRLEAALIQRARLLNALLVDVYGAQTLLQAGVLPPELVFAHPGFLRPCHNVPVPEQCYLHLYAVDLARFPDGQWRVLADYAQNPVGAGYALESRLILNRTFADVLREVSIQRLARFFESLRQTLQMLAPRRHGNPRIVLLTPGPSAETYFEHVYLARYLGYTLVEDGDLTVRDQSVFLKTLAGLQPVDVILRQQDDALCDPLALSHYAVQGTAGLVEAVRAGNVTVANALGSGWLDTPALLPLLPAFCRHLLGEDLHLPTLDTWWCGQPDALDYVLQHLDQLVVRPLVAAGSQRAVNGAHLSRMARGRLTVKLRTHPYAYVAQLSRDLSTIPVWNGNALVPGSVVLRAYLAATADGYTVMPGGLTRLTTTTGTDPATIHHGEGRKDTWILADGPITAPDTLTVTVPSQPVALRRSGYDLPSRVADNFLWLGRYAERAESAVRLLRSIMRRLMDDTGLASSAALPVVLRVCYDWWHLAPPAPLPGCNVVPEPLEHTLLTIMFAPHLSDSVRATLSALHRVAAALRDRISIDSWRILTRLDQEFTLLQPHSLIPLSDALELLNQTLITLAAFSGLGVENMTRGPGWHFLDMGRRLERAIHTLSLLRHTLVEVGEHEGAVLDTVLEVADSSMTYRSRYLTTLQFAPVLDLLLTDDTNPRSVLYQLVALTQHVQHLPHDAAQPVLSQAQRLTLMVLSSLQLAEIEALCTVSDAGKRNQLATFLAQLLDYLPALGETLTHQYFSHAAPARHLAISHPVPAS